MYLLGIDIGTSACKIAVFDLDGNIIRETSRSYSVYYPRKNYAEQNPNEWYKAVCEGFKALKLDKTEKGEIAGIGIDGQGWSCVPVDKAGNALYNTPIWYDTRAVSETAFLEEKIGFNKIFQTCGNPLKPSYTTPKALWFKNNFPGVYNNTYKFLQSNSYIAYKLTGAFSQDKSQGYGHFFYDTEQCCYNTGLCAEMGLDINKFPAIYDCHAVIGKITPKAAEETGLPKGIPVMAGGLDAACGALGAGVYKAGQTQEQGGQAGGMSICVAQRLKNEKLISGNHAVPGLWLLQGGTVGGGGTVKWFSETFKMNFSEIDAEASEITDSEDRVNEDWTNEVLFLPYMAGERSPIWDENAKGMFFGLSYSTTRGHLARAVMEGVAYSLKHNLETAEKAGAAISALNAVGGAADSGVWTQIKADITGKIIQVTNSGAATVWGAAILAGVGIGAYKNFAEAAEKTIKIKKIYYPRANSNYGKNYEKYLKLYENTKELTR
jgi:xylulokinase